MGRHIPLRGAEGVRERVRRGGWEQINSPQRRRGDGGERGASVTRSPQPPVARGAISKGHRARMRSLAPCYRGRRRGEEGLLWRCSGAPRSAPAFGVHCFLHHHAPSVSGGTKLRKEARSGAVPPLQHTARGEGACTPVYKALLRATCDMCVASCPSLGSPIARPLIPSRSPGREGPGPFF
jgi:hypothetical protein